MSLVPSNPKDICKVSEQGQPFCVWDRQTHNTCMQSDFCLVQINQCAEPKFEILRHFRIYIVLLLSLKVISKISILVEKQHCINNFEISVCGEDKCWVYSTLSMRPIPRLVYDKARLYLLVLQHETKTPLSGKTMSQRLWQLFKPDDDTSNTANEYRLKRFAYSHAFITAGFRETPTVS